VSKIGARGIDEYRKQTVTSASPVQLVIMLYDAAIRHCEIGKQAIIAERYEIQNDHLTKAQRIITELMCSLDMEKGGEISQNLLGLYTYCNNQLVAANIDDNPDLVDGAVSVLIELREAWRQIAASTSEEEERAA